jgi:hypothetical protein
MTQRHSTNTRSIRAHARVALAVCLLGKSKVQTQWPFLFAPLLGVCVGGASRVESNAHLGAATERWGIRLWVKLGPRTATELSPFTPLIADLR